MKKSELEQLCDRHAFPRNARRTYPDNTNQEEILRELNWLAGYETSPDNPNSMGMKDENAAKAFFLAGQLLGPLLEWAIDHTSGRVLMDREPLVSANQRTPEKKGLDERINDQNIRANSHENEFLGSQYVWQDPIKNRRIVGYILYLLSRGLELKGGIDLSNALAMLDYGDTFPELQRIPKNRIPRAAQLDRLRLSALGHVAYGRRANGWSATKARTDVCWAYGVSEDAIKKWGKNGGKALTALKEWQRARYMFEAESIGWLVNGSRGEARRAKLPKYLRFTDFSNAEVKAKIKLRASRYSKERLETDGAAYQELLRASKNKPPANVS